MTPDLYNLIVVAHPDDETIYFAGPILGYRDIPWKVICITDGDADGNGSDRAIQFAKACKTLAVDSFEQWDFPDVFEKRLDVDKISKKLSQLPIPHRIYTHGIIGEYSHPHHQDVSYAVHACFSKGGICKNADDNKVMSISYNTYPDEKFNLSRKDFETKTKILSENYADEMNRFLHLVPASPTDSFTAIKLTEVQAIYRYLTQTAALNTKLLDKYLWLAKHIQTALGKPNKRLF